MYIEDDIKTRVARVAQVFPQEQILVAQVYLEKTRVACETRVLNPTLELVLLVSLVFYIYNFYLRSVMREKS